MGNMNTQLLHIIPIAVEQYFPYFAMFILFIEQGRVFTKGPEKVTMVPRPIFTGKV